MSEAMLNPQLVRSAYLNGWFPMADEDGTMAWYQPQVRALFPISGVHVSRSLARRIRKGGYEIRLDTAFDQVIASCRRPEDNWINEEIIRAYSEIHRQGWAHCIEIWEDGELTGGLYGLSLGACFSAESMFHRRTDASKLALWAAVEHCRKLGYHMFDAQVMNPHLARMGAYELALPEYLERLDAAMNAEVGEWTESSQGDSARRPTALPVP